VKERKAKWMIGKLRNSRANMKNPPGCEITKWDDEATGTKKEN